MNGSVPLAREPLAEHRLKRCRWVFPRMAFLLLTLLGVALALPFGHAAEEMVQQVAEGVELPDQGSDQPPAPPLSAQVVVRLTQFDASSPWQRVGVVEVMTPARPEPEALYTGLMIEVMPDPDDAWQKLIGGQDAVLLQMAVQAHDLAHQPPRWKAVAVAQALATPSPTASDADLTIAEATFRQRLAQAMRADGEPLPLYEPAADAPVMVSTEASLTADALPPSVSESPLPLVEHPTVPPVPQAATIAAVVLGAIDQRMLVEYLGPLADGEVLYHHPQEGLLRRTVLGFDGRFAVIAPLPGLRVGAQITLHQLKRSLP